MTSNGSRLQQAAQLGLDVTPQLLAAIDQLDKQGDPRPRPCQGLPDRQEAGARHARAGQGVPRGAVLLPPRDDAALGPVDRNPRPRDRRDPLGPAAPALWDVARHRGRLLVRGHARPAQHRQAVRHGSLDAPADVTNVLFSTLTSWLRWELRVVVLVGLLAALVLWLSGPSKAARGLRRASAKGGASASHAVLGDDKASALETRGGSAVTWIAAHAIALAWAGVAIGGIVLAVVGGLAPRRRHRDPDRPRVVPRDGAAPAARHGRLRRRRLSYSSGDLAPRARRRVSHITKPPSTADTAITTVNERMHGDHPEVDLDVLPVGDREPQQEDPRRRPSRPDGCRSVAARTPTARGLPWHLLDPAMMAQMHE